MVSLALAILAASCGNESFTEPPPPPLVLQLSPATLQVLQDGSPATLEVTVTRPAGTSRSVTLSILTILPAGVSAEIEHPGTGSTGKITFTAAAGPAGTYSLRLRASDGVSTGLADFSLLVAIIARLGTATTGRIDMFMSTSFQPASWTDDFFVRFPEKTVLLEELRPRHVRLQPLERDIPQRTPASWDFTFLDRIVAPIFTVADHSPQFQIARGPDFMYTPDGRLRDLTFQELADYSARLVKYYNTGGFTDGEGNFHQSPSPWPITYWGIYNEPNINNLTPDEYVRLYNVVVPAMLSEDPTIKLCAVELSDWGDEPQRYLPPFVSQVTAQVDVLATHYYSSCDRRDSDRQVFSTVPGFVEHINYIYSQLQSHPALANVPVWVTENNVNADWSNNGVSVCTGLPFAHDLRGSSAFFAAWRPYVFSQFAQAGVRGFHHWSFNSDIQFGEVDHATGQTQLSYWVDYWLARFYPSPPGSDRLALEVTDADSVEALATLGDDGTLVVMIANRAVANTSDNNGPGAPRTIVVDTSAWGPFTEATRLTLDAQTNPATGPAPQAISPASRVAVTLNGYGVTWLTFR